MTHWLEPRMSLYFSGEEKKGCFNASPVLLPSSVACAPTYVRMYVSLSVKSIYVRIYPSIHRSVHLSIHLPFFPLISPACSDSASSHFCLVRLKLLAFPVRMNNEAVFSHPQYVNLSPEWTVQIGFIELKFQVCPES